MVIKDFWIMIVYRLNGNQEKLVIYGIDSLFRWKIALREYGATEIRYWNLE